MTPVLLNLHFHDISVSRALPDVLHDLVIPCRAHLSASVEALQAAESNHHHDLLKDFRIRRHEPVLIVWCGHFSLVSRKDEILVVGKRMISSRLHPV